MSLVPRGARRQAVFDLIETRLDRFDRFACGVDNIAQDAVEERLSDFGLAQFRNASGEQPAHAVRIVTQRALRSKPRPGREVGLYASTGWVLAARSDFVGTAPRSRFPWLMASYVCAQAALLAGGRIAPP
jgi:hypothetical protein